MALAPSSILGIGAPLMDNAFLVSDDFIATIPGEKGGMRLISHDEFTDIRKKIDAETIPIPAGCTVNVIRGLAHLGHSCIFHGKAGTDKVADVFKKNLENVGVRTALIPSKTPTAQVLCLITPDGERTLRSFIGAAGEIQPEDIQEELFTNVRHVHIEGYCMYYGELFDKVVNLAKKHNATVSMDLGSFETVQHFKDHFFRIIKSGVTVLFGNEKEAQVLTDKPADKACRELAKLCDVVSITEGSKGCWVQGRGLDAPVHCDAEVVDKVVDTTGAGDSFASGFLHGYLTQSPLVECARKGAKAASMMIQIRGTDLPHSEWLKIA